jgi:hypothetical protein
MSKNDFSKAEKQVIMEMAERCAGVAPGEKYGRWTHEDRVMLVYSVLCSLYRLNKRRKLNKKL